MRGTHSRRRACLLAVLSTALLAVFCPASPAQAADPPFIGWSAALPPLTWQYDPNSADECVAGRVRCVEKTIAEMQKRYDPLADACAHSAVFGLAYLRTTETYLRTAQTPGFYADPAFVNHEDAAFADMYFTAYDDWAAGRVSRVPPAWRIALDAGAKRQVSGTGDLLLGMNAHVNRDLPFVLAQIGLVAPDGSSRKPDHDKIDAMLNQVVQPLVEEEAARYDPQIELMPTPYGVGYTGLMQMLVAWRESAWRQAEQLALAPDGAARALVADAIEKNAATNAQAIVAATRFLPPVTSTNGRDRYCATQPGTPS
jgi:Family of unknown function (DUF5995)